jgi:hypothetical protein
LEEMAQKERERAMEERKVKEWKVEQQEVGTQVGRRAP